MIRVITPATSANLGPGFDTLGIAVALYNTFEFTPTDDFMFENFSPEYATVETNLVAISYIKAFDFLKKKILPVRIGIQSDIPNSRGLGSSSSCIIAGLLAANYFMDNQLSEEQLLMLATSIEGHPDNVTPCLVGGLVSSVKNANIYVKYPVNANLMFNFMIPNFSLNTSLARSVLPKTYSLEDVTYNLSRIVNLPIAMANADFKLLNVILKDCIHEPYRYPLIPGSDDIRRQATELGFPVMISGAGPTIVVISDRPTSFFVPNGWEQKTIDIDTIGARVEVIS